MRAASALILAGGKSSRFGRDKTQLKLNGATLAERAVEHVRPIFDEILIAGEAEKFRIPGARAIPDIFPGAGPLGGIHSGLSYSKNDAVFALACDMPNFDAALCKRLISLCETYDIAVPRADGEAEPLFAVYRKAALPAAEKLLREGNYRVRALFSLVNTGYLDVEPVPGETSPFFNINYKEDYERLIRPAKED
ncbi:MAG TPA: molybdenum cofactor guanylyltransferase [Clostridia bacterium]|nr:molybdenum cofactor guanylyltransferase [Clostridia bacterium]